MKNTYIAKRRKVGGFTLLELLVVVGILAIIAGAIITAYDGFQRKAALQTASNTVASMTNTIRTFIATSQNGALPNNVESLISAAALTPDVTSGRAVGTVGTDGVLNSFLSERLAEKLGLDPTDADSDDAKVLTDFQVQSLVNAGIDTVRYIEAVGDDRDITTPVDLSFNGAATRGIERRTAMQGIYAAPQAGTQLPSLGFQAEVSVDNAGASTGVVISRSSPTASMIQVQFSLPLALAHNLQS